MRVQTPGDDFAIWALILIAVFALVPTQVLGQGEKDGIGPRPKPQEASGISNARLTEAEADAIQIQMDTKGPIFVYGAIGGDLVAPVAGQKMNTKLQVFADGKLVVGGGIGVPRIEAKFTEPELVEFLDFVVNRNGFYQLDSLDIKKRMAGKESLTVADANSSVFAIDLLQGKHEVAVYSLWNAIKNFPDFEEIQRLSAIENRCNSVISQVHLGGEGDKVLKILNEKVADLGLGLAPFTLDEMRLAARRANGRFQVSFQRAWPNPDGATGTPNLMHAIYFVKDANSQPQVTFYNLPKKK